MMMKKRLTAVLLVLSAAVMLTACGSRKKEVSVDVQKLADDLNSQTVTSDTLSATAADMIPSIYYLDADAVASAAAYMSGGATASEIAVIESKDASHTKTVEEKLKSRVSSQSDLYASYNADEVSRLKGAIIKSAGRYTVLAVCDDTAKANELLKSCGF